MNRSQGAWSGNNAKRQPSVVHWITGLPMDTTTHMWGQNGVGRSGGGRILWGTQWGQGLLTLLATSAEHHRFSVPVINESDSDMDPEEDPEEDAEEQEEDNNNNDETDSSVRQTGKTREHAGRYLTPIVVAPMRMHSFLRTLGHGISYAINQQQHHNYTPPRAQHPTSCSNKTMVKFLPPNLSFVQQCKQTATEVGHRTKHMQHQVEAWKWNLSLTGHPNGKHIHLFSRFH